MELKANVLCGWEQSTCPLSGPASWGHAIAAGGQRQGRVREGRAGSHVSHGARSTISLALAGTWVCFWSKANW